MRSLVLVALALAGCLAAPVDGEEVAARALPYERSMSFATESPDLDDPIRVEERSRLTLSATNLRAVGAATVELRLTLVDPSGNEHGECQFGRGSPDGSGGACSFGASAAKSGVWHVRYQPTGALQVDVSVSAG